MVGGTGPRMLGITLPHVDAWNTWYEWYGNTPEGFAARNPEISAAAEQAGRDPADVERSACVLVVLDRAAGERPITPETPPVEGPPQRIAAHLRELAEAGADEAILVVSPITERSVRTARRGARVALAVPAGELAQCLRVRARARAPEVDDDAVARLHR